MNIKYVDKIIIVFILIIIVTFIFIKKFSNISNKLLNNYVEYKMKNEITSLVNNSVKNILYSNSYNNIIISNNNLGKIDYLDFDNEKINKISYEITNDLLRGLLLIEEGKSNNIYSKLNNNIYYVPMGMIFNNTILNSLGPKVPFKVELVGGVNSETKINVKEYGINSSLVYVILDINITMQVIMPFKSKIISTNKDIIIDSKIIQGEVPNYYGGIMGLH